MSDFLRILVFMIVLVNPVTAALATLTLAEGRPEHDRRLLLGTAGAVAIAVLGGSTLVAGPVLDALDISFGAAQLAAGIVLLVPALELMFVAPVGWVKPAPDARAVRLGVFPLGFPVLAAPWTIAAVLAFAAADGAAETAAASLVGVAVAVALAAILRREPDRLAMRLLGFVVGAATALVGADLIHDGVFGT